MIKVGLVIRLLGDRSGGAERLYCEMANWLSSNGYEVHCIYSESGDKKPFYPINDSCRMVNLFSPFRSRSKITKFSEKINFSFLGKMGCFQDFIAKNYEFAKKINTYASYNQLDVLVSLLPSANTPLLMSTIWKNDYKVVVTNHNVPYQDYDNPGRWSNNPLDIYLRKKLLKRADIVHCLFNSFGDYFKRIVDGDKVRVVENYVGDEYFNCNYKNNYEERKIVAVGRLAPVKNYECLIKAWSLIEDKKFWKIEIYGVGPDKKKLEKLISDLNLSQSVKLKGHTKNIKDVYLKSSFLCHPAKYEGFGLSVAEALSVGLPVVAFQDCEGVNQFVKDNFNGIMSDRGNSGEYELSLSISKIINDKDLYDRLSENCRDSVMPFNSVRYYEQWQKIIKELV
jgi:glycosyltransferase involved in cell wall biosynthesis